MNIRIKRLATIAAVALLASAPAHAGTIQVFGPDLATAKAAEASFLAGITVTGFENFEGFPVATNSTGQSLSIGTNVGTFASITQGSGGACDNSGFSCAAGLGILNAAESPFGGRFNVSDPGNQWLDSFDARVLTFAPSGDVTRVGFFITDPNDAGGRFDFTLKDGTTTTVEQNIFGGALTNGRVFYVTFVADSAIELITIATNNRNDGYGLDDVTVGVPAPGALALLGAGLLGIGAMRRRRRVA